MAKSKFDAALCMRHLTEEQRAQLPADIWQFVLDSQDGKLDAVYAMRPVKIREAAPDFVSSEIGRTYWPLRGKYQVWPWEMPVEEVCSFVADAMIQERKKHTENNPAFLVDHNPQLQPQPSPSRVPTTPKAARTPGKEGGNVSRQRKKQPGLSLGGVGSADMIPPSQQSYTPSSRDKDNTASTSSATTTPVVKRSIKPTEASRRIALDSMDMNIAPNGNRGDTVVAVSDHTEGEHVQPDGRKQGLKRAADNLDGDGDQPATPTGAKKKRATSNRKRPTAPPSPREDTADLAVMRSAQPKQDDSIVNGGVAAPTDQGRSPSPAAAQLESGQPGIVTLEAFHGLQFDSGNLVKTPQVMIGYICECAKEAWRAQETASVTKKSQILTQAKIYRDLAGDLENKIPKFILGYIRDCEEEAWRAQETASVTKKSQILTQAKIYRDLAWDLENKIRLLAADAEKKGVIETEYVLMDLKHQEL